WNSGCDDGSRSTCPCPGSCSHDRATPWPNQPTGLPVGSEAAAHWHPHPDLAGHLDADSTEHLLRDYLGHGPVSRDWDFADSDLRSHLTHSLRAGFRHWL